MGCLNETKKREVLNTQLRNSIRHIDYANIFKLINENDIHKFDPTLLHESVKTGQLDLVSYLLDNSNSKKTLR